MPGFGASPKIVERITGYVRRMERPGTHSRRVRPRLYSSHEHAELPPVTETAPGCGRGSSRRGGEAGGRKAAAGLPGALARAVRLDLREVGPRGRGLATSTPDLDH